MTAPPEKVILLQAIKQSTDLKKLQDYKQTLLIVKHQSPTMAEETQEALEAVEQRIQELCDNN